MLDHIYPIYPAGGAKGAALRGKAILTTRTVMSGDKKIVYCAQGTNNGKKWKDIGEIVTDTARIDVGDGCLLARKNKQLWYSCRHNDVAGSRFAIEVYTSTDGGKKWKKHSTVAASEGKRRGLWSSFLLEKQNGDVWCFYDDEDTPYREGFVGHQWFVARRWDEKKKIWGDPVVVSRANDPKHLSRDGMGSVVEMPDGELICVLESVQTTPLHAGNIRLVSSIDGGKSWSHLVKEREVIYQPGKPRFAAYCPWLTLLPDGELLCVFATNEDQSTHDAPATPAGQLHCDIKLIRSKNRGRVWSAPLTLYSETHRAYMPQLLAVSSKSVVCLFLDFQYNQFRARLQDL
jgi:hypothetical protein